MRRKALGAKAAPADGAAGAANVRRDEAAHSNPMVSVLGYHTLCPFAPWSTLTLLFLAGLAWVVRGYMKTQSAG